MSYSGRYAICQTVNNPENEDGNRLAAFDLEKCIELFYIHPITELACSYIFIEENPNFIVVIDRVGKFKYDEQGNFIDAGKYNNARLNSDRFEMVLQAAEEILKEPQIDPHRTQIALAAALKALSLGAAQYPNWKAQALKIQGLAHEILGDEKEALLAFEESLKIDPEIGVKGKADALRKNLESS